MVIRIVKLALVSFVLIFLLVTAISLLIPSHIRISKAVNVKADKDSLRQLILDTAQWKRWHPAFMEGAQRKNLQLKRTLESDSLIKVEMGVRGQRQVLNAWQLYEYSRTDSLTIQWYMDFHLKWYPWQKFGALFYEGTYGAMMEQGLGNIRQITLE